MDEPEFVVTEGRAYHRGDVVILRVPGNVAPEKFRLMRDALDTFTDRTGVEILLISGGIEVVEPVAS